MGLFAVEILFFGGFLSRRGLSFGFRPAEFDPVIRGDAFFLCAAFVFPELVQVYDLGHRVAPFKRHGSNTMFTG
jgi:hypothetical protein